MIYSVPNETRWKIEPYGGKYLIIRRINGAPQVVAECRTMEFANMVLIALSEYGESYPVMRHALAKAAAV